MPNGFNPCFDGSEARARAHLQYNYTHNVSILVLMEVKREPSARVMRAARHRFNPCFDGSEARERMTRSGGTRSPTVSILVLMEVKRERRLVFFLTVAYLVSILVLMEVKREDRPSGCPARPGRFQSLF